LGIQQRNDLPYSRISISFLTHYSHILLGDKALVKGKLLLFCVTFIIPCSLYAAPSSPKGNTTKVTSEESGSTEQLAKGRALFTQICSRCHKTTYDESIVGAPGLQGVLDRHDEAWLNQWIKSPEAFAKTDSYAKDLVESNRFGLAMPTFPAMQNESNRKAIIEYLKTLK